MESKPTWETGKNKKEGSFQRCAKCNKGFYKAKVWQKFCSDKCRVDHWISTRRFTCPNCKSTFPASMWDGKVKDERG